MYTDQPKNEIRSNESDEPTIKDKRLVEAYKKAVNDTQPPEGVTISMKEVATRIFQKDKELDEELTEDDQKLLAAIQRGQEEMRPIEGVDIRKIAEEAFAEFWGPREAGYCLVNTILTEAHGFWERRKLFGAIDRNEKLDHLKERVKHIKSCEKCLLLLNNTKKAIAQYFDGTE